MAILRLTLLVFSVNLIINMGQSKKIHLPARKTHHGFGFDYVKDGIMGKYSFMIVFDNFLLFIYRNSIVQEVAVMLLTAL